MERDGMTNRKNPKNFYNDFNFEKWFIELNKGLESFWESI
jgi:hypothetical protein